MPRELHLETALALWPALLDFRRFLKTAVADADASVRLVREQDGQWSFAAPSESALRTDVAAELIVPLGKPAELGPEAQDAWLADAGLTASEQAFLRLYLPVLLGSLDARRAGRAFVTAHVAQTVDGRIACQNGHSHWISNQANLFHAHRLRALHDAILVGGRTVVSDDPALTVRHVPGDHPRRVVLTSSGSLFDSQREYQVMTGEGCLVLCSRETAERAPKALLNGNLSLMALEADEQRLIPVDRALESLYQAGLHSVFLEGGAFTLSRFLERDVLDFLHIHVAPMILGSGINSFSLPEVQTVQESRYLKMTHFDMDGELLLECRRKNQPGAVG